MKDPLAKKLGDKAANVFRQQVKDVSEELKEFPKSGKQQITGEESQGETDQSKKDSSQSGKQQLLTLLRGSGVTDSQQTNSENEHQEQNHKDYLEKEILEARRQREEKEDERQRTEIEEQQNKEEAQTQQQDFVAPAGRKPRGMQNPMDRKGSKKNELGRTAKG